MLLSPSILNFAAVAVFMSKEVIQRHLAGSSSKMGPQDYSLGPAGEALSPLSQPLLN